jgi:hypothetical protein
MRDAEEELIKTVLKEVLRKDPTEEDAKHVSRVFRSGVHDKYSLVFHNVTLGIVEMNFSPNIVNRYIIRFTPAHIHESAF